MMYRNVVLAAVAAILPAAAMAQTHTHTLNCGHQFTEDQGVLNIAQGLAANAASQSAAQKMTFILNDLGGVGAGTQARAGFEMAAGMWSKVLKDPITIRLDVRFAALGPNILGPTGSTTNTIDYAGLRSLLAADSTSFWGGRAVNALQTGPLSFVSNEPPVSGPIDARLRFLDNNSFDNNNIQINTAQVKALGLNPLYNDTTNPGGRDGSVSFSTLFTWDFDPTDGITPGSIDFVGVAAHEIGHALGFRSGVDLADANALPNRQAPNGARGLNNLGWGTVHDLQRYGTFDGQAALDWSIGGNPCFSVNAGQSCLARLSTGSFNGDGRQASHWKDDIITGNLPLGIMDPTATGPGGIRPFMQISRFDLIAFDTMGYDLGVPEPSTWAMLIAGFGLTGASMRRRRRTVAA
jgi:hypothetical protein